MARRSSTSPPETYIAWLRSVNVGGRSLPMADLRRVCEAAGATDVRTYIQSGNVVLRSARTEDELVDALETSIADHAGFEVPIAVRTVDELTAVVDGCPFHTTVDPKTLVVSFAQTTPDDPLGSLDPDDFGDERLELVGRDLYLLLPHGQGRSPLVQALARTPFGKVGTARNWKTVLTVLAMARETATSSP